MESLSIKLGIIPHHHKEPLREKWIWMAEFKVSILILRSCPSFVFWILITIPNKFNELFGPFRPLSGRKCWIWIYLRFILNIKILIMLILHFRLWIWNISKDIIISKWIWWSNYTFFRWMWILDFMFLKLNTALYETLFHFNIHEFVWLWIIYISQ